MKNKIKYFIIGGIGIIAIGLVLIFTLNKKDNKPKCIDITGGSFNLVFDTNEGNKLDSINICIACSPDTYIDIPSATKNKNIFAGWYYDKELTKEVTVTNTLDIEPIPIKDKDGCITGYEDITIYAKWTDKNIDVKNISLDKKELKINVGDTSTVNATIEPKDATNKTLKWSSSDDNIATVSNGKITGIKEGKATITVKTNNDKKATISVNVIKKTDTKPEKEEKPKAKVESITLDKDILNLDMNGTKTGTVKATVKPANADQTVTWTITYNYNGDRSSTEKVVSINNGTFTALRGGKATIEAKAGDKTATMEVRVQEESLTLNVNGTNKNTQYVIIDEFNNNGYETDKSGSPIRVSYTYWHYYNNSWGRSSVGVTADDLNVFRSNGSDSMLFGIMNDKLIINDTNTCENIYFTYKSKETNKTLTTNSMNICPEFFLRLDDYVEHYGISYADCCFEIDKYCNEYTISANPNYFDKIEFTFNQDITIETSGGLGATLNGRTVTITNSVDNSYLTVKTKGQTHKYKIVNAG